MIDKDVEYWAKYGSNLFPSSVIFFMNSFLYGKRYSMCISFLYKPYKHVLAQHRRSVSLVFFRQIMSSSTLVEVLESANGSKIRVILGIVWTGSMIVKTTISRVSWRVKVYSDAFRIISTCVKAIKYTGGTNGT